MATSVVHRKRAALHTLGCRLNQSETALIVERLHQAGYEIVPFGEEADLGIINTCTVTGEADAKSRQLIRGFIRKNPCAYTAVIGCYSQMGHKALSEIDGVDLIIGNQEKLNLLDYVAEGKNVSPLIVRDRIDRDDFTIEVSGAIGSTRRANLKIQDGCDFMCSFCVIPFARGRARSRDLDNLVEEGKRLVDHGAREIVLTGVNVGTYSFQGSTIVGVVERLNDIEGLRRIRISSIEPTTIPQTLFGLMKDPDHALVPYLHVPLQSGSNHVLGLMKRRYSREAYLEFVQMAWETVPGLGLGTDVLVGTPGETDRDFEETCELLETSPLQYAHVFKYSERQGTAACRYPDKIDGQVKNRRSARIRRISAAKRKAFFQRHLGTTVDVLFEMAEDGYWSGYTENYIRVAIRSDASLENQIRSVRLDEICGDFVLGTLHDT